MKMVYFISIPKDDDLSRRDLLYSFAILERNHKSSRGEMKEISLHCKYDLEKEKEKFMNEEIDVYLRVFDLTADVEKFIANWKFIKNDELPNNLKHILGFYRPTLIYI